jgi:hypothetical protein
MSSNAIPQFKVSVRFVNVCNNNSNSYKKKLTWSTTYCTFLLRKNLSLISKDKCDYLAKLAKKMEIDVIIVLQETHTHTGTEEQLHSRGFISGYNYLSSGRIHQRQLMLTVG